jgi:hypothetical protein
MAAVKEFASRILIRWRSRPLSRMTRATSPMWSGDQEGRRQGPPGEASKEAAELDQHSCMYEPHVLAMMTGQNSR